MAKNDISKLDKLSPSIEKALSEVKEGDTVKLSELPAVPEITKILQAYPEDKRQGIELTRSQVEGILKNTKISTFGVNNTLPMICTKEDCNYKSMCVFYKMGIAPEGDPCPDEIMYLDSMVPQLVKDMHVDMENYLEISMVQEYAAALLDKRRAERMIAQEGDVKEVPVSVVQQTGTVIYSDQISPYMEIKEKAAKKLSTLRKELLATREQRAKYKLTDDRDASTKAADLRERFEIIAQRDKDNKMLEQKNLDDAFNEDIENDS
tara:strand:+ start:1064 stop:1855 length:792 start_codon:yes stop_codon:yes gene_type:complete